eukprot:scaffold1353_cov363-Pavlova_lutheri.AAC.8
MLGTCPFDASEGLADRTVHGARRKVQKRIVCTRRWARPGSSSGEGLERSDDRTREGKNGDWGPYADEQDLARLRFQIDGLKRSAIAHASDTWRGLRYHPTACTSTQLREHALDLHRAGAYQVKVLLPTSAVGNGGKALFSSVLSHLSSRFAANFHGKG